jgi:serine/threonine protein kinase
MDLIFYEYVCVDCYFSVMFRIVEDDMPPLPEGASALLQDFLTVCFNKDPTLRPSAELLCEHEWLKKSWSGLQVRSPSFRYAVLAKPCK